MLLGAVAYFIIGFILAELFSAQCKKAGVKLGLFGWVRIFLFSPIYVPLAALFPRGKK